MLLYLIVKIFLIKYIAHYFPWLHEILLYSCSITDLINFLSLNFLMVSKFYYF